ncbi:unnamed protein product [Acanthoscelides obtectus]|uniref:DUF4794 domain-containing protein n=1 Tax=Acanthoscelides obtectus TaxID=200917 RepID=A0A9P0KD25_ACAOB|nr:unnamed protein product [Acanthoscelides obtectus]CAK1668755.1 hypothetical protein AOBTE_LOCUS26587 [Acanthoscelides obtectus]
MYSIYAIFVAVLALSNAEPPAQQGVVPGSLIRLVQPSQPQPQVFYYQPAQYKVAEDENKNVTAVEGQQKNTTEPTTPKNFNGQRNAPVPEEQEKQKENLEAPIEEMGVYYIYHPTGLLQRVMYATKDDARNMAFSAKLKYKNVEPVSGPIYTYDPETYVFKQVTQ